MVDMGKTYGIRFDLWVEGRLGPQLVLFEKDEPPIAEEIAACVRDRAKTMQGKLFGSESEAAEIPVEYRPGVANDQEFLGSDPGFGVLCQEVKLTPHEGRYE
ncbi:MAG: hypothetical protein ACE5I9_03630 [Candidatus Methylomirabilales bacterium]